MNIIVLISALIIPLIIFFIVVYGIIHHTDVYDEFIAGAADGMKTVVGIAAHTCGTYGSSRNTKSVRLSGFFSRSVIIIYRQGRISVTACTAYNCKDVQLFGCHRTCA